MKASVFITLVVIFIFQNAFALEENEVARKPTPIFIRRLFQMLFEKDGDRLKEKREVKETESKLKGSSKKTMIADKRVKLCNESPQNTAVFL